MSKHKHAGIGQHVVTWTQPYCMLSSATTKAPVHCSANMRLDARRETAMPGRMVVMAHHSDSVRMYSRDSTRPPSRLCVCSMHTMPGCAKCWSTGRSLQQPHIARSGIQLRLCRSRAPRSMGQWWQSAIDAMGVTRPTESALLCAGQQSSGATTMRKAACYDQQRSWPACTAS